MIKLIFMYKDIIQNKIHIVRGTRVMLDYDLAELTKLKPSALKKP